MPTHPPIASKQPDPLTHSSPIKGADPSSSYSSLIDDRGWLARQYQDHRQSTRTIAAAVGGSREAVRRRLHRYGIVPRRRAWSASRYYDAAWLEREYVDRHGSLRHCADLANVAPETIRRWLGSLGIEIRDRQQAAARRRVERYP